ncbi:MAG: tetratricopeptide repeat protein [Elusimicrobia bacterium]|nr:tetratricopeptide repeat protein [Elusimicrobiota bacterium]MDE2510320.1 tetratricopeptide repeat protein [Elusimicrobiota bacterium]
MSIQSSEEYEKEGLRLLQAERPAEALDIFVEGTRRFPGDADLTMGTAMSHLRLGDYLMACEILERLRITHRSGETLQALAEAYLARGMVGEAVRAAKEAADGARDDARQLSRLGRSFYANRRYGEALPFYELAAEASPEWSETWFGLGACQWALRQAASAEAALRRAVELEPQDWQARQFLGCVLCDVGRKKEAREMLESVPLDVTWQKPALERLVAMAWWPSDPKRSSQMEKLWQATTGSAAPKGALDVLEEVSRKMDEPSS